MEAKNRILLVQGAEALGAHLDEKAVEAFNVYLEELLKWNRRINLTAVRTENGIVLKHFIDSLSIYPYISPDSSLLDVGSGAGFPGIPLKIARPDLNVTLIDSVRKKVDFQRHIIRTLGLKGIRAIHGRVQEKEILERMKNQYDRVVSRAFSNLKTFLTLSQPFLNEGGRVLAMKGELGSEEIRLLYEAEEGLSILEKKVSLVLPFSSLKRSILIFQVQPSEP